MVSSSPRDRRYFDDGDCLDDFSLVHLGSRTVEIPDNVSHTRLVPSEGSEMHYSSQTMSLTRKYTWLLGVILGEGLNSSTVTRGSLSGKESQGSVTRCFEFTVTVCVLATMN